jgi:MSHA biogenesis protein MshJ
MAKLQELQDKWMALSKRERWMIFGAGLLGVLGIMDTFLHEPIRQQNATALQEVTRLQEETSKAQQQLTTLSASASGGKTSLQAEIDAISGKIKQQEDAMVNMSTMMVKPNEVLPLLKALLSNHDDIEVVNLESLPVDNFIKKHAAALSGVSTEKSGNAEGASNTVDTALNQVYQHTIKLTVRGNYLAVMNYAQDLKKQSGVLSWELAEMKSQFPKTELTVHLYTLSMQNAWLGI